MADCVSLQNAAELVDRLRATAKVYYEDSAVLYPAANTIEALMQKAVEDDAVIALIRKKAEDEIEQLLAENAKLKEAFDRCYESNENLYNELQEVKAERDAAVDDLEGFCGVCKHEQHLCCNPFDESDEPCLSCDGSKWEWRGVQKEGE